MSPRVSELQGKFFALQPIRVKFLSIKMQYKKGRADLRLLLRLILCLSGLPAYELLCNEHCIKECLFLVLSHASLGLLFWDLMLVGLYLSISRLDAKVFNCRNVAKISVYIFCFHENTLKQIAWQPPYH